MRLHVQLLLRLVEGVDTDLEELVLHAIVLFLGVGNFLGRLVVSELSSLGQNSNVCRRINLLKTHLKLVEEPKGDAAIAFHDLVDHLGVKLDVEVSQGRLKLLKVLQAV